MKKNIFFIEILFLIILILNFYFLFSANSDIPQQINQNLEDAKKPIENAKDVVTNSNKDNYLKNELKQVLLKNNFIAFIDNFLKKINFVFVILLGQDYEFSFTFFFSIILWSFFLINFNVVFRDYSGFSENIAIAMSFLSVIAISQIGFIRKSAELFVKIILFKGVVWSFIIFLVIISFLSYGINLVKKFGKTFINKRKLKEKMIEELDRKILHTTAKSLEKINEALEEDE